MTALAGRHTAIRIVSKKASGGERVAETVIPMDRQAEFLSCFLACELDMRAFIGSLCRDAQAREDVFQEMALVLWKEFDRFDRSRSFGAWARGIVARKLLQRWRADRRKPLPFSPEALEAVVAAFDRTEEAAADRLEALERCLDQLPERSRKVLALRYESGRPVESIAAEFETTLAAMYQTLSRLRHQLLNCIKRRMELATEVRSCNSS